ncbi:hypothetical protein CRE_31289 [Caenorhabditis remanei]|uniref:Serpentine receptor class gamma n=1 Tax=Caenorhabditis remanei TaxID=31234 RepID=E3MLN8_CAERE|nr:hypothetical protein CRE_31289 [Caenorhabditis remanei]
MLPAWLTFCIYLFYGIPSFILYILTFYIILRYRKTFHSSFFHLYLFDGALNLFTFLNNYFKTRIPGITGYNSFIGAFYRIIADTILLDFTMLMNFHMAYVQYAITTLVSLNRLSVMLKYTTFEPLWRKYTWIAIVLICFVPLLNTEVVLHYDTQLAYLNITDTYSITTNMPIDEVFSICIPFMIISTVLSVVINFISVIVVRNLQTQIRYKVESNFIMITCITCLVQLCGTVLSVVRVKLVETDAAMMLATFIPLISDGLSLVQPWLLLAFSHVVREKIIGIISWKKLKKSAVYILKSTTYV